MTAPSRRVSSGWGTTLTALAQVPPSGTRLAGALEARSWSQPADQAGPSTPRIDRRNHMLEAAAPLLCLVAGVQAKRPRGGLPELHRRAMALAAAFDDRLASLNRDAETLQRARFAVFATVDDAARALPRTGADGAEWVRRTLVRTAFGRCIDPQRFHDLLDEMLRTPSARAELIDLYHACLVAGFIGGESARAERGRRLAQGVSRAFGVVAPTSPWSGKVSSSGRGVATFLAGLRGAPTAPRITFASTMTAAPDRYRAKGDPFRALRQPQGCLPAPGRPARPAVPPARARLEGRPWYVVIGPDGGIAPQRWLPRPPERQPLGRDRLHQPRWFDDEAVLVAPAGGISEQGSAVRAEILSALRQASARPPTGVIVSIGVDMLLTLDKARAVDQAWQIRERLSTLSRALASPLSVELVICKADLMAGFDSFFEGLGGPRRRAVVGVNVPEVRDGGAGLIGAYDQLTDAIVTRMAHRLAHEREPRKVSLILGFPSQLGGLRAQIHQMITAVSGGEGRAAADQATRLSGVFLKPALSRPAGSMSIWGGTPKRPLARRLSTALGALR